MATYFVATTGSNTSPYDTEAKAALSIVTVAALWTAADTVRVRSTHNESTGVATTLTFPATRGLMILSVAFDGAGTGALTAGAVIGIGAASVNFNVGAGFVYGYGITWSGGTTNNSLCDLQVANPSSVTGHVWELCTFDLPSVNSGANLSFGAASANDQADIAIELINCTWANGAQAARSINLRQCRMSVRGLAISGTAPTTLFALVTDCAPQVLVSGSDLSGVAWTNLVDVSGAGSGGSFVAAACKMPASWVLSTGAFSGPGAGEVVAVDCDSGDLHYVRRSASWAGTITVSNAIYADAGNGTDTISWQMVSSANASFEWPLRSQAISLFNSGLTARTAKLAVINDGTTFKDNELWVEALAKVTTGVPRGTWDLSDRAANILAAGTNQTTDTTTWTGTGGFAVPVKQELKTATFTPAEIGPITAVVALAKPSATVYVSPRLVIA